MPLLPTIGRTVGTGVRALRMLVRGGVRGGAWATRRVGSARAKGAANEAGMVRLFDLHALSCAGDTLIAIGLAGTIFFSVPLDEARSKARSRALMLFKVGRGAGVPGLACGCDSRSWAVSSA